MQLQITVVSAPKLDTLGKFSDLFDESKIMFGSTVIQVLAFHNTLSYIRSSTQVSYHRPFLLIILFSMLNEEFVHRLPISGGGFYQDLIYHNDMFLTG